MFVLRMKLFFNFGILLIFSSCSILLKQKQHQIEEQAIQNHYNDKNLILQRQVDEYLRNDPKPSFESAVNMCQKGIDQVAVENCHLSVFNSFDDVNICEKLSNEDRVKAYFCYTAVMNNLRKKNKAYYKYSFPIPQWCKDLICRTAYFYGFTPVSDRSEQVDSEQQAAFHQEILKNDPHSKSSEYVETEKLKLRHSKLIYKFTEAIDLNSRSDGSLGLGYAFLPFKANKHSGMGFSAGVYDFRNGTTPYLEFAGRGVDTFSIAMGLGAHFPKQEKTHYHAYVGWGLFGINLLLGGKSDFAKSHHGLIGLQFLFIVPWM